MSTATGGGNANSDAGQTSNMNQFAQYITNPDGTTSAVPSQLMSTQSNLNTAQAAHAGDQLAAAQLTQGDQMARFNQILPLLTGQLNNLNSGAYTAGGSNSTAPPITTGPVLNPQQIQQQVNQSNANTDKSTATNIQQSNGNLGGRGFGSNSPLQMMLNQAAQSSGLATKTGNETNLRLNAANANASNLLNTQQALSNQWATSNQLDINRRTPIIQQQTALLGALANLV